MQSINETNPALALAELLPRDRLDLAAFQAAADRLAEDKPVRNKGHILAEYSKAARALNGHSVPSRRITNTFSLAVSDRVRVENTSFTDLLAMLKAAGQDVEEAGQGQASGSPVQWLVTMHQTGKLGNTTTALSVDGKRVVRATHESGAIWVLKGLARASGGRVVFVKPSERLGKGDLMRLRGVQFRGGKSCTISVAGAGQEQVDRVAEAKARQVADAVHEQLERQRQASAFSCVLDALCNLPDVERKPLLKADGEQALRAWVDGQLAQLYDTADARYKYRLDAVQLYRLQITAPEVIAARKAAAKS